MAPKQVAPKQVAPDFKGDNAVPGFGGFWALFGSEQELKIPSRQWRVALMTSAKGLPRMAEVSADTMSASRQSSGLSQAGACEGMH